MYVYSGLVPAMCHSLLVCLTGPSSLPKLSVVLLCELSVLGSSQNKHSPHIKSVRVGSKNSIYLQ